MRGFCSYLGGKTHDFRSGCKECVKKGISFGCVFRSLNSLAQKAVHAGIRTGSGSYRVAFELRALWLRVKCWVYFFSTTTRSLPLPVLIPLRALGYLLFVQSLAQFSFSLRAFERFVNTIHEVHDHSPAIKNSLARKVTIISLPFREGTCAPPWADKSAS
jgi:hypothetical protein